MIKTFTRKFLSSAPFSSLLIFSASASISISSNTLWLKSFLACDGGDEDDDSEFDEFDGWLGEGEPEEEACC